MSAVDTERPKAEAPAASCPRCGAPLEPGQEWCLNCGEAVATDFASRPGWRLPAAIVGTVLALGAAVLVLAFAELSDDAERAADEPAPSPTAVATATPTQEPSPTPSPGAEETPAPEATAEASPTPEASPAPAAGEIATWPAGQEAWTVVLLSSTSKDEADERAREVSEGGTPAGVLRSDDYSSLRAGYWVVFSGQYETQKEAQDAAAGMGATAAGAYARFVKPR